MSSDRRLFRYEAFERRGQREPIDGLLRVTAPHEWAILLGLLVALLGVLAWGLLGSIERTVEADCVLVRPGDRHAVLSDGLGDVVDIFVNEGDSIDVGQPIASLRASDLHRQIEIARARVEALEAANNSNSDALALAQAELAVLEEIQAAGESIISPFTGEITYLALVTGQSVEAGAEVATVLAGDEQDLEVVALVSPKSARRLNVGMEARVLNSAPNRIGSDALDAQVREISQGPDVPPPWLSRLGLEAPPRSYTVNLKLLDAKGSPLASGDLCSLRVVLSRDAPVRFLTSR